METKLNVGKVMRIERTESVMIPPGRYPAIWSGYQVKLTGTPYVVTTEQGVRGFIACSAVVSDQNVVSFERSI